MPPDSYRIICIFLILLLTQQVEGFAQVKAQSNYLVNSYSARDMNAGTQNWDFAQNSEGLIYIANRDGILEFDGTEWRRISVTKQTPLRSLAIDENDTVYAGAVGEFGYLAPDSIGKLDFISLSQDIEEIIADVWETHATSHGIYFVTRAVIYRYFNGEISRIKPQNVFQRSFKVGDMILVSHQGMGLLKLVDGELTPLDGADNLLETSINSVLRAPSLFNSNDGVFFITTARTAYHYGFDTKESRSLITINNLPVQIPNQLYKAITLKNGDFAFATLSGGLYITDHSLQTKHHIDSEKGLQIDMALSVFEDSDRNIWVGLNNGISVISEPDYITFWDTSTGLVGGVLSLYKHRGDIFVGNSSGLYKSVRSSDGLETTFEKKAFENFQIWSMVNHSDRPHPDILLFGSSRGFFSYYNGTLHRLIEHSTFSISASVINPYRYYLGFRDGWAIIEFARFNGSELQISNYIEYDNPSFEFRSIEESRDGTLWLGSRFNGLFTADSNLVWGPYDFWDDNLIRSFNTTHGLPNNANNALLRINDEIVVATENGLFTPVIGADTLFVPHPRFENVELSYLSAIQPDSKNQFWVIANNELVRISQDTTGVLTLDGNFLASMGEVPLSALLVENGQIWVGTAESLIRINPDHKPEFSGSFSANIRAVYLSQDSLIFAGSTQFNKQLSLKYGQTDITFQYSSPRTVYKNRIRYQTKLEGYDQVWSNWTFDTRRTYTNLSDGTYAFKVRAIDVYGNISSEGIFEFMVESPWFKSIWAYFLYLFLVFMGGFIIVKLKDRRFEIRKNKLEEKVALRTAELQVEKRRLENLNENLRALDENRDKFLSVVAHDLRNPLMIIRSSSTLIDEEINDEEAVKEFSKYIYDAALKMQDIIENLLEDRAKKIRLYHDLDEIPVKPIVLKICEENKVWVESKQLEIELDLDGDCVIKADSAQIGVIFDNLISNAIKYSPLGRTIYISLKKSANNVVFSVRDEGAGMTPYDIREMGKPFKTLSAKPTAGESSSGMGLYIVKDLLKSHDGVLSVSSPGTGKGTTFTVTFKSV